MEQVDNGARHRRGDAKPFYRNVYLIKNWDFIRKDGERYMPTQSEVTQIRLSPHLGQYKKKVEFYQNMSEKMVMEKLEETFPYLRDKSYACTVVTSRPARCMSTSRIWDGKTIKRNTQGNSALYILEDEVTQKNDSSDQPKSKHRHDKLTSLDQSQKAANELSSLGIGAPEISGQEEQPTSCGSHTRCSTSHGTSGSWLTLKEFLTAETSGAKNIALQGVTRLPQNQKSGNGTRSSDWYLTEVFGPTPNGLETGLRQEILPSSFWVTGPDPPLRQAPVMEKSVAGERNTISTSSLHQNYGTSFGLQTFSSTHTPQMNTSNDLAEASQRSHELCLVEAMETSRQLCSNETAAEDLNLWPADPHPSHGASRPDSPLPDTIKSSLFQNTTLAPRPRAILTSENSEMPQESPHETNDAINSSAPVALSSLNQPTLSDTSATIMVQNTLQPPNDNPIQDFSLFPGPSAAMVDMAKPQNFTAAVAFPNTNQPSSSDSSATFMVQNNMEPWNDFLKQDYNNTQDTSVSTPNFSTTELQNAAPAADDDSNLETIEEQMWKGMTDSGNSQMADDNDHTVASLNINQPTSSESSAAFMDQNNMYPFNDSPMLDYTALLDIVMSDSSADNHSTTSGISGLDHNLSLDDLWRHEDKHFRISVEQEKVPLQMPQESPHETNNASNSSAPRTAEIREFQLPLQGFLLNSTEMSDSSADNYNTTSGISELNNNSSDDQSPAEDEQFVFSVTPKMVPLEGADLILFESDREFPEDVQFASASFEGLGNVDVERAKNNKLLGERIPPAEKPGWVRILLKRPDGRKLGETKIKYYDGDDEALKRVIKNPKLQARVFRNHAERLDNHNTATVNVGEAQHFGICGSTQPVQMLCALVYAAAEIGSQQFIEMIFKSSAGRVVFHFYRDRSPLPEAISKEYGHEKTAIYLEEITKRFYAEASEAQNYPQTIDWSELVRAAEEAQKESGFSTEEDTSDALKNTGYLGDIDTSSNESCESVCSESEDNIPLATSKEMDNLVDGPSKIGLVHKDQEFGIKEAAESQSLTSFCKNGHFNREQVNSTMFKIVVLPTLEGWQPTLLQDSFIREAYSLKHLRSLNRCDSSFFLGSEQESIHCHLITEYEMWCFLFKCMKDNSLHRQTFVAEVGQFVEQVDQDTQAVMMGTSFGCVEDHPCIKSTRELVTTSDNPGLAVQWNSTQGSTKHCTSSDLWVLTCLCRPARNILFVYVADNCDVLPQKAYFDDDRYELSIQYWQRKRYCSSLFDVQDRLQEMRKLSEQMRPEFGPAPLPTYNAKMFPQVPGKQVLRQPECCPTWLYTMIHQCWVHAPVERPSFIAILDGISSRTLGAHSIVTWLSHCNQGKYLPLNNFQSEDPCLASDKTNHPSSNVNVTDCRSERETLNEEHLHGDDESNVVFIDKHLLLRERINNEKGLPLITAHPPSKIFYRISEGIADAQNEVNIETSSICRPGYKGISRKQRIGLHDDEARSLSVTKCLRKRLSKGLADSTSPTEVTLTINCEDNNEHGYLVGYWGKGLDEGLARNASLTAFTPTINNVRRYLLGDWGEDLGEGLAKNTSLTAFTLIVNSVDGHLFGDWGKDLGACLAKSRSLTAFTLTVNNIHGHLFGDWGKGLGEGLAKSRSLTAFNLTINRGDGHLFGNWGKDLGEVLVMSTSLTAFTLTVNNVHGHLHGDWGKDLGAGLAKSRSLTAFTLTVNSVDGRLFGDWGKGLGEGLARSASLIAFTLTVNGVDGHLFGDWGKGLGEGLARSASLTAFTLTVNSVDGQLYGDLRKDLGEGLGKSKSLTAFTQTINSVDGHLYVDWGKGLGEGLAKSKSITVFTLISIMDYCLIGKWVEALRRSLQNSKFLFSGNVRIAGSSSLDGCFSSFDFNGDVRGSPPCRSFNPREKEKIKSIPDETGSSEEATDCILML